MVANPKHPPGPPMDLANMRQALPRSVVPVILVILSIVVIGVAFYLARWLTAPV
jgi:hypothetical protein